MTNSNLINLVSDVAEITLCQTVHSPYRETKKLATTTIGRWKHDWVRDISAVPSRFIERQI